MVIVINIKIYLENLFGHDLERKITAPLKYWENKEKTKEKKCSI